ncbi:tetratricopeptide repeat protein [Marinobacter sp. M216]|uniref:Tetratricopeptide repeat protein n=1 Tax=Marinobacter albus TaxID=3030833 RepID=A0ABT7HC80_9GAMM|nr:MULTISPECIES: tetratricopeptide repeat protein [unclassified Marinobacter]MBW7469755.1 tetratricopeptide repeat protein [Marinobacter sp. F4218]MDK9557986.1 tetratricopeptide repeat protein [Marinobacter sp. M216]
MKGMNWIVKGSSVVLTLAFLAGCASTPAGPDSDFSGLYSGKSDLTFSTLMPIESAAEGIARGDAARARGELDQAIFEYIRTLELEPNNPESFYKIGAINLQKEELTKAHTAFQSALENDPDHAGALEGMGLVLMQMRQPERARIVLEKAVSLDPKLGKAHNALGILADLRGDFGRAAEHYNDALMLSPLSARLQNNLGYSHYLSGEWDLAERAYLAALNVDPWHQRAWRNLGQLYTRQERYDEALEVLTEVMSEAEALNTMGYICMSGERLEDAEKFFTRAAQASPSYYVTANENLEQVRRLIAKSGS